MSYQPDWIDLPTAIELITKSNGASPEKAQAELSYAISDGAIQIRARLDRHSSGIQTSSITIMGDKLGIPKALSADNFDWTESRPIKSWLVRSDDRHRPGYWFLKTLEVCRPDVETKLLDRPKQSSVRSRPDGGPKTKKREAPTLKAAQDALNELFPERIPPQHELLNKQLVDRVIKHVKKRGGPNVSETTILRAAGRRK